MASINPNSNNPDELTEDFRKAQERLKRTVLGVNADNNAKFAESHDHVPNSSDPNYLKEEFKNAPLKK